MTVRLSPRARRDLDDIWKYSESHWGADRADAYIREIQRATILLDQHPALGRACPDVRAGYHEYPSGSHLLFYRIVGNVIEAIRVLHERMDADRQLRD